MIYNYVLYAVERKTYIILAKRIYHIEYIWTFFIAEYFLSNIIAYIIFLERFLLCLEAL